MGTPAESRKPHELRRLIEELERVKAEADAVLDRAREQLRKNDVEYYAPTRENAQKRSE